MKRRLVDLKVEVKVLKREQLFNLISNSNITIKNSTTIDNFTLSFDINYKDYKKLRKVVKRLKGKIKIVNNGSLIAMLLKVKNNVGIPIGLVIAFLIFLVFSNFVWRISIEGKSYLPPYEIRAILRDLGIKPGMKKASINVYEVEKELEKKLEEIMWINARVEGSTLKIKYEEKILTSVKKENEDLKGTEKVAIMDAVVKRVYTTSGMAKVKPGDVVKKGDVIIVGEQGEDLTAKEKVIPEGVVLGSTFYEKNIETQISGEREVYTKNKDSEIFLEIAGKKIYLKKPTKEFENYDKIEEKGKFFNKSTYYEKKQEQIVESEEAIIEDIMIKLEKAVTKEISRDAVIVEKKFEKEDLGEGKINLKVLFVVEQNIVSP
ncbi:MAG: sporulation protein YqfD [Sarcina sp.]